MIDGTGSIASSAYAGHQIVGPVTSCLLLQLVFDLTTDDTLQTSHQFGVRVRTHCTSYYIKGILGMTTPVANGLVGSILQSLIATLNWINLCTEHAHAFHIHMLALYIQGSHIYSAGHVHKSTYRGSGHTMLTSTCLSYNTCFTHPLCQQNLPYGIVYLMSTSMVEVLTLEVQFATVFLAHAFSQIQWAGTTYIVAQQLMIFLYEIIAFYYILICQSEILHSLVKNLRDIGSTEFSVEPVFVDAI